jgi:Lysyl oxidase
MTVVGLALPGVAHAASPQLPDLIQFPPTDIRVQLDPEGSGDYQLGFTSQVGNVGFGPFEVDGTGPGSAQDMTARQIIHMDNTSTVTTDPIGVLHYESSLPNHNHWHFQPFDSYELRRISDNAVVAPDQKEGFCLIDGTQMPLSLYSGPIASRNWPFDPAHFCEKDNPDAIHMNEGISVGWTDTYAPFRGGQDVVVTGVPAGRYYLVHHVNMNGAIQELNPDNDVATATVDLTWPGGPSAMPKVVVLKTCFASATCPYTDPLPPPPPSPPAADVTAPKLLLGGATRQRFLRGRSIYVYAKCDEACTISASGRIAALQVARSLTTATTKLSLKPGVRTMIKLRISRKVRATINRQLARGAPVTVRVTLVATDAAGNKASETRRLLTLLHR